MAIYYADSVNGNDANPGTASGVGNAKATASAAIALATGAGDAVEFAEGTYPLTANITTTNLNGLTFRSAAGLSNTAVQFTGAFQLILSGAGKWRFINLNFKNYTGTTGAVTTNNSSSNLSFEDCAFDGASSSTSRCLTTSPGSTSFNNCIFKNFDYINQSAVGAVFENCIFQDITGSNGIVSAQSLNSDFIGCTFIKAKNCLDLSSNTTTIRQDLTAFRYCTFDLKDAYGVGSHGYIYRHSSSTNLTVEGYRFSNNLVYRTAKIIHDNSTGQLTISAAGTIKNNWIQSGTNVTRYNSSGGDITGNSDPLFYDASTFDYRLEPTSTAAVGNNGLASTMGANELESPATFFSDPGVSNVFTGIAYRFLSRLTNNRTGTLVGYALLSQAVVKIGEDRGDGLLGTYDGSDRYSDPGVSNVKDAIAYKFNSLTDNRLGTNVNTSPGVGNVVAGITWYLDSVLQTGTRTSIYALLSQAVVKIDEDRGDGQLGTYVAAERYSDPGVSNTRLATNYKFNSLTNNRVGTAAIPTAGNTRLGIAVDNTTGLLNLPAEADVLLGVSFDNGTKTGSRAFYALLSQAVVKIGVDRGDGLLGNYDGSDRYSDPGVSNVRDSIAYKFNSLTNNRLGIYQATADYPIEAYVKDGIAYDNGNKIGSYGRINLADTDLAKVLTDNAKGLIQSTLGSDFTELKYFKEIEKNDFYSNAKTFGIRCMDDKLTNEKVGLETLDLQFEIKLTSDFNNRDGDDDERVQELALIQSMEKIRRSLRETKFAFSSNVRIIKDWERDEIVKLGGNVLLCRAVLIVNINVKND